jgi:hypothetical protein
MHLFLTVPVQGVQTVCQEPGPQKDLRLQIDRRGLFFADFLLNMPIFGCEIVKNLSIAGANFR